jgi:hypothetical protein
MRNHSDLSYLQSGNARQQEVYNFLLQTKLLESLAKYRPVLVGTFPIGVDVPGSDLDVICEVHDFGEFESRVLSYLEHHKALDIITKRKEIRGIQCAIISCDMARFSVQIFGQPVEVHQQYGFRHMAIERRVLQLGGQPVRERILQLRERGLKTEPAFAHFLGLNGDPFEGLLELESWSDDDIYQRLSHQIEY